MVRIVVALLVVVAAGCSTGPDAPPVTGREVACADTVCVAYPEGWEILEVGPDFIRFAHPAGEDALATVAPTNLRAVVEQAGGTWPATPTAVAEAFWRLLAETGVGELGTVEPLADGRVRSFGAYGNGRMWVLLVPVDAEHGIGVEVRGPNRTWESHAEVFFSDVVPVPATG